MELTPGTRIGPYEILSSLGAGGMGAVYRARDTKLGRDVALKILPESFASDADRLARFEREAQMLASLNHPHIAQIHGFEHSGAVRALVMELVEGEDLSQRIAHGAIALDEALPIARQIAEALEAAHEQGIIHRDLKPANIKLRGDGTVKVLDFGLAKALGGAGEASKAGGAGRNEVLNSPTMTSPAMTRAGVILGTAAYMAPEQARGKAVDKRADIWAFGCVLYEMLTARRPFGGESITDTLSAITRDTPDWTALPGDTPPAVRRVLMRCLEKDPKQRLRDVGDARIELSATTDTDLRAPAPTTRSHRGLPPWTVPAAIALTAAVILPFAWRPTAPDANVESVRRFEIQAPELRIDAYRHPVIAPNGEAVAWPAGGSLWVRALDRPEPRRLVADVEPLHLVWSPDSQEIAYFSANRLWRVRAAGGEPVVIADATFRRGANTPGAARLEDGRIVFASAATGSGLLSVNARGGAFETLLDVQPGISDFHSPSALPGNRGVVLVLDRGPGGSDDRCIGQRSVASGIAGGGRTV